MRRVDPEAASGRSRPEAARDPSAELPPTRIAKTSIGFIDATGTDHDALGPAPTKAIYNYMHGIGLEQDVRQWFALRVPKPTVPQEPIARALAREG